jgi:hypothetical protein
MIFFMWGDVDDFDSLPLHGRLDHSDGGHFRVFEFHAFIFDELVHATCS